MISYSTMRSMATDAARAAKRNKSEPATWHGDKDNFRIPFLGEYIPKGWHRTKRDLLFVDTSGFGGINEPAMTQAQFFLALEIGKGYALIEQGQFQGYIAEYERINR